MYPVTERSTGGATLGGGAYNGEAAAQSQGPTTASEIAVYGAELNKILEYAHSRLSVLENRLQPALRPQPPSAGTAGNEKLAPASPLAEGLRGLCCAGKGLAERLNRLIDAVDL